MVALAPAGVFAGPAGWLASYAPTAAGGVTGGAGGVTTGQGGALDRIGGGPAALAQISDAAQALFARMRQQGVSATSFDLHVDLAQLGLSVDGSGRRSVEGHSLSVDLHVEAQQGVRQGEGGAVQFGRLSVQFEMTETSVVASQGGAASADGAGGADGGLEDSLASLGRLLDGATADVPGGQQVGLDDLIARLGDQVDRLRELLGRIGGALRARAHGGAGASGGGGQCGAGGAAGSAAMAVDVHIRALSLTQVSAVDGSEAS